MKQPHQITGIAFMFISAWIARESLDLEYYTPLGPGGGFFPFWLSLILGLVAASVFYQATYRQSEPMPQDFFPDKRGYLRMGAIVLALIGTMVLMKPLGFRLTMLTFLVFMLFALGRQGLLITSLVALAGGFGTYHAFVVWLKIPLPIGMFGF